MVSNFKYSDFYNVALFLMKGDIKEDEASIRTAIGRIYYSLYLILRDKAINLGFKQTEYDGAGGSHKQLLAFFEKPPNKIIEDGDGKVFLMIVTYFKPLQELRIKSDYKEEEIKDKDFELAKALLQGLKLKLQKFPRWDLIE